jgi:GT2 family glycosyltransferase
MVDWVSGACLLARQAAIATVGPLDEEYFMYTEETDWCFRMWRAGWSVMYLPEARAVHWIGQSAHKAPERRRTQVYRSKLTFLRKHRPRWQGWAFLGVLWGASRLKLVFWLVRSVIGSPARRRHAAQQVRSYRYLLQEL